jgi:membrane associated rhomboid family serine protease
MRHSSKVGNYFARTLALAIACCIVVFLIQVVIHDHENGQNEASCRVCHAAHIGAAPAVSALLLAAPLLPSGSIRELAVQFHKDLFSHDSPSRAPPIA